MTQRPLQVEVYLESEFMSSFPLATDLRSTIQFTQKRPEIPREVTQLTDRNSC